LLGPATNWRLPFLVMAAPTLLLVMLLLLTVKEPPRGGECAAHRRLTCPVLSVVWPVACSRQGSAVVHV
jgi:predicted MFS family arabinose efflux permease